MKDIEVKTESDKFKYRVNGIVIGNGKMLTIKMKNNVSYCLPGGHVELGEDSKEAIIREIKEELETDSIIDKELAIVENFYVDKNNLKTHELSFYYLVKPVNFDKIKLENYSRIEIDKGEEKQLNFEWLELKDLMNIDFRPSFLKEKLSLQDYNFEHIIIKQ
jgi:ADP-ribose pyrophosphatase YjhB (NUDIX family)